MLDPEPAYALRGSGECRYCQLRIRTDDGVWYGEFLVLTAGRSWAKVMKLFEVQLSTADVEQTQAAEFDGFKIEHAGDFLKWRVIRVQDSKSLREQLLTRAEAELWLREHLKAIEI